MLKASSSKPQLSRIWHKRIAREYIEKARTLGASEMFCDLIGIGATSSTPPSWWQLLERLCRRDPGKLR